MSFDPNAARPRITGGMMANFLRRQVTVLGFAISIDATGRMLCVKTTDSHFIVCQLTVPYTGAPFEKETQLVEVEGIVETKNKVKGYSVNMFSLEMSRDFDQQLYTECLDQLLQDAAVIAFDDMSEHFDGTIDDPQGIFEDEALLNDQMANVDIGGAKDDGGFGSAGGASTQLYKSL